MQFRQDIQALRGIAILLVVFYHAQIIPLSGGYLGVDVFFVLSGFLITRQIRQQLNSRQFSFSSFYLRRAWRLLPAAYTVFVVCAILSPILLSYPELRDFQKQLVGAISFTSNFVLWQQTGYFENAAELKPLLHSWSLSIEEQYYIAIPIILVCLSIRWQSRIIAFITLTSFILFIYLYDRAPDAAFYFTPARIWALGIGSLLALNIGGKCHCSPIFSYVSLILIFIVACFQGDLIAPIQQANTLLVVLAIALLILNPIMLLQRGPIAHCLSWFGGISYSLYLVHWPIFAFINATQTISIQLKIFALVGSITLAKLLNSYVEKRFRITQTKSSRSFTPLILASIALLVIAYLLPHFAQQHSLNEARVPNKGLSEDCQPVDHQLPADCRTHPSVEVLLWGDSLAMHLVPALLADKSAKFMQSTRSECIPINATGHFKPLRPKKAPESKGRDCAKFNHDSLLLAINDPNIHTVILASTWHYILAPKSAVTYQGSTYEASAITSNEMMTRFINTLKQLQAAGKKVVMVEQPPKSKQNIVNCHIRESKPDVSEANCLIDRIQNQAGEQKLEQFVQALEALNIPVYRFKDKLCNQKYCLTVIDGEILYRDTIHFSVKGAHRFGEKFGLYQALLEMAR